MATNGAGAAVLAKLFGQGGGGADSLELANRRGARMTELETGIGQESGFKDPVSAANILRKGLFLRGLERDAQMDPMTGLDAQKHVAGIEAENDAFNSYVDPENTQMRNEDFGRKMELATAPARIQGEYAVRAAESKSQGQLDALSTMLGAAGGSNRSLSLSGVGSIGAAPRPVRPQQIPATAMNKYQSAVAAAEKRKNGPLSGIMNMLGLGSNGPDPAVQQARRNAFQYIVPAPALDALDQAAAHFKPGMPLQERLQILSQMADLELTQEEFEGLSQAAMEW